MVFMQLTQVPLVSFRQKLTEVVMVMMEKIWLTSWYGKYPILFTEFYRRSQVVQDFFHQE